MSSEKKNKSIGEAIRAIHKQFGSGSIMRLDGSQVTAVEVIPTGSVALDVALGCGGLPRGRIVEIYGPESSGKTTLTLHAIAEAQRAGGVCAFIDAEHALDTGYARRLGVDLEDLLVSQPDCGEQALEICDTLVRTSSIDLIVIDSVAALTPRAEIEGEMGESHMGLQARLMSQALRKLTAVISRTRTVVVFINQDVGPDQQIPRSSAREPAPRWRLRRRGYPQEAQPRANAAPRVLHRGSVREASSPSPRSRGRQPGPCPRHRSLVARLRLGIRPWCGPWRRPSARCPLRSRSRARGENGPRWIPRRAGGVRAVPRPVPGPCATTRRRCRRPRPSAKRRAPQGRGGQVFATTRSRRRRRPRRSCGAVACTVSCRGADDDGARIRTWPAMPYFGRR